MDPPTSRESPSLSVGDCLLLGGLLAFLVGSCLVAYGFWGDIDSEQSMEAGSHVTSDKAAPMVFPRDPVAWHDIASGRLILESTLELQPARSSRLRESTAKELERSQPEPGSSVPNFPKRSSLTLNDGSTDWRDWLLVTSSSIRPPPLIRHSDRYQTAGQSTLPGSVGSVGSIYIGNMAGE